MSRQFTATVLLEHSWALDIDALAAAVSERFPYLGPVDGIPGQRNSGSGVLSMEGASAVVETVARRARPDAIRPPQDITRPWDPKGAVNGHRAHLNISCGGRLPGLEGAMSYAAAVMFVTTAALDIAAARAVLWRSSWSISSPNAFRAATEALFEGQMPVSTWVSFAPYVPEGYAPAAATGMSTLGLSNLLGRELELAPRPGDTDEAEKILSRVARQVLDTELIPRSGHDIGDTITGLRLNVRKRDRWFQRDKSAFVLVAGDSVVDRETLKPVAATAA